MEIKAVVFDYGKVICFPPEDSVWGKIASLAGTSWDVIDPIYRKYRSEYDRGMYGVSDYYRKIIGELKLKAGEDAAGKMGELDLGSWKNINAGTVRLMEDVKKSGRILGILSNMPFDFLKTARVEIPVFSFPDCGIFSCEAGYIKPEKEIYLELLSRLNCRGEEVVFFDDVPENVDAAREQGIEARLWENCEKARADLSALGVIL